MFLAKGFWLELPSAHQRAMLHISCNTGICGLPDHGMQLCMLSCPQACILWAYTSGKSLVPTLPLCITYISYLYACTVVTKCVQHY